MPVSTSGQDSLAAQEVRSAVYCTSFCNHGHRLRDGMPVEHQCYRIPPNLLEAERQDSPNKMQLWSEWSGTHRQVRRGVRAS